MTKLEKEGVCEYGLANINDIKTIVADVMEEAYITNTNNNSNTITNGGAIMRLRLCSYEDMNNKLASAFEKFKAAFRKNKVQPVVPVVPVVPTIIHVQPQSAKTFNQKSPFIKLPTDILYKITDNLDHKSLSALALVTTELSKIASPIVRDTNATIQSLTRAFCNILENTCMNNVSLLLTIQIGTKNFELIIGDLLIVRMDQFTVEELKLKQYECLTQSCDVMRHRFTNNPIQHIVYASSDDLEKHIPEYCATYKVLMHISQMIVESGNAILRYAISLSDDEDVNLSVFIETPTNNTTVQGISQILKNLPKQVQLVPDQANVTDNRNDGNTATNTQSTRFKKQDMSHIASHNVVETFLMDIDTNERNQRLKALGREDLIPYNNLVEALHAFGKQVDTVLQNQNGGKVTEKFKYNKKLYKVRIGPKGGRYILVSGNKVYVK